MNLTTLTQVSQADICRAQDVLKDQPQVPLLWDHFFADGVYLRVMKTPANTYVIGKAHRTRHFSILLKGSLNVTMDDGTVETLHAPHIMVTPAGKKKMLYMLTDTEFANIHPTDTEDLDEIENRVIEPEEDFRLKLGIATNTRGELQ